MLGSSCLRNTLKPQQSAPVKLLMFSERKKAVCVCVDANNLKDLVVTTTLHENYASPADDRHMMAVYELQRCRNELNTYNTVTPMIRTAN